MKVQCLNCSNHTFEIEVASTDFSRLPIISIACPKCGKSTALAERSGGGLQIALDAHVNKTASE